MIGIIGDIGNISQKQIKDKDINGDCLMVSFYVPCVWDMKDADIPPNKYMASLRIKNAVKDFLKDDINWKERLGELYAAGCS